MTKTTNKSEKMVKMGLLLGLAGGTLSAVPAWGDVVATAQFFSAPSYKLAGNSSNYRSAWAFGAGGGNVYQMRITGTLSRTTAGTFPREACIRVRRLVQVSPSLGLLTHEFIAQPFTSTAFDAEGNATVSGVIVLPAPQDLAFGGAFSSCSLSSPGTFEFEFFEQYDDDAASNLPTPDAVWSSIRFEMDTTPPSLETAAPLTGTVATSTRYGVRSDDTLGAGTFTGGQVSGLEKPAGSRIRHVRVSGYVSSRAVSTASEPAGPNETSQARLRLRRSETVLLSPGDPQGLTTNEDLTVALPSVSGSTQYVCVDVPLAADSAFGNLMRTAPSGGEQELYLGVSYLATAYESTDHSGWTPDNVWNGLKIEFFSDPQAPAGPGLADFGVLNAQPAGSETVMTRTATMPAGQAQWFAFTLPGGVGGAASGQFLDIDTEGTAPLFDTMIGLYGGESGNAGQLLASDDDDGSGSLSQLSFGDAGPRSAVGNSQPRNGRDGVLAPGRYYVAAAGYVAGTGLNAFGPTEFAAGNPATAAHPVTLNLRFNVPTPCGQADIGRQGGLAGADGTLNNNDFIVFIDRFFANDPTADRGVQGGIAGSDGLFNNNDFIVFINQFFGGCGQP